MVPLKDFEMSLSGNDMCLCLNLEEAAGLSPGSRLRIKKQALGNGGRLINVCNTDVIVNGVVNGDGVKYVYFEYVYIEPLTVANYFSIMENSDFSYKLYFTGHPNMVRGDIEKYEEVMGEDNPYRIYAKRNDGSICWYDGLDFSYPSEFVRGEDSNDGDGGYCSQKIERYFNYETMELNSILAKNTGVEAGDEFVPSEGDQVVFATNPYYFIDNGGGVILFDNVTIEKYTDYRNIGLVIEDDYDAKRVFQEYQVNELFVDKIKKSVIPNFIDLEKIKYAPAYCIGDSTFLATGLTFNLHFRSRVFNRKTYTFDDVWHVDDDTKTWNGNGIDSMVEQNKLYLDGGFVNTSNLIGFLGFTDDDIYNQKNRVKKTFLRLSFYDSKDPLTQNLLFYSTIFMDSGELFGKFVKRKASLENQEHVVWSSVSPMVSAVTSQFTVNDEYDITKSGEGFNVYLFKEDAPVENEPQPIYMKVEFNHAGYGRTVPMIFWPKDVPGSFGVPVNLTTENYLKYMYIDGEYSLTDKGYVYSFPDIVSADDADMGGRCNGIVWENDRIVFNLFEPMLTLTEEE